MARLVFGRAVLIAHSVDFSEHARGGIVTSAICRHGQELLPKLSRRDRKHLERTAPLFGWNVLRDGSFNGSR